MSYLHSMPFARHEIRCLDWVSQRLRYVQPIIGDGIDTRWPFGLSIDMSQLEVKMQFSPCLTKPFFLQSRNSCCIFGARSSHEFVFPRLIWNRVFLGTTRRKRSKLLKKGSRVAILQDTFVFWLISCGNRTSPNHQTTKLPTFSTEKNRVFSATLGGTLNCFRILFSRDVDFSSAECNGVLKILRCWPQVSDIDGAHCEEFPWISLPWKKGCTPLLSNWSLVIKTMAQWPNGHLFCDCLVNSVYDSINCNSHQLTNFAT